MTTEALALPGSAVPGLPGAVFDSDIQGFFPPSSSPNGNVIFRMALRNATGSSTVTDLTSVGVFGPTSSSPAGLLFRSGDKVPGLEAVAVFDFFEGSPVVNDNGDVAFSSAIRTAPGSPSIPSVYGRALIGPVAGAGSPTGVIARENDLVPGSNGSLEFGDYIANASINAAGDIAFIATLRSSSSEGTTSQPGIGLFLYQNGEIASILGKGDLLDIMATGINTAEQKTVSSIIFHRDGLNDAGEFGVLLSFTDNSQGMFVLSIPEPFSAFGLIGLGGYILISRRRGCVDGIHS